MSAILMAAVYGIWYADTSGIFDRARDAVQSSQDAGPTPTAPTTWTSDSDEASGQEWGDKWVSFSLKPHVCGGVLEFRGMARNGARVSYSASHAVPFALYKKSALAPRPGIGWGGVDPIAIFLRPLTGREYYPALSRDELVADVLVTPPSGEFRVVVGWPQWLQEPGDVALGVWGYRPDYGEDALRLSNIEGCPT